MRNKIQPRRSAIGVLVVSIAALALTDAPPAADESPFVKGLSAGERETLLYVWTRDADGADEDFIAVVDVDPESETYGTIIETVHNGATATEAHHFGYNVEADRIFAAGMFTNQMFIYDLSNDPRKPELIRTVDLDPSGYSGPHTMYAVPGGVMVAMLGSVDHMPPGGLVMLNDDGDIVTSYPEERTEDTPPTWMYDVGVKPAMNRMITSSWAPPAHIMGENPDTGLIGNEMVVWDWEAKEPLQVEHVDLAPLEVRWMHGEDARGGFVNAALGNSVWYWEDDDGDGTIAFHKVIDLGEGALPADMRISYDNTLLYVSHWGGGKVAQYDISDPMNPVFRDEIEIAQPNMMKLSPDSRRLYVTNSILSNMDGDVTFGAWLLHVGPDGMEMDPDFAPDFNGFATGPGGPHDMLLR